MKKKILLVQEYFYPSTTGGPSKLLYDLAKAWHEEGNEVFAISSTSGIEDPDLLSGKWTKIDGVNSIYLKRKTRFNHRILFAALPMIKKIDVLFLSSFCYLPYIPLVLLALFYGKKVIWGAHGETLAAKGSRLKAIWFWLIKVIGSKKVVFHATTEIEYADMRKYLGNKSTISTIPIFLDLPKCFTSHRTEEKFILFVGRLAPIKCVDNLIKAVSLSHRFKEEGWKLIIAGPTEEKFVDYLNELKSTVVEYKLENSVEFIGNIEGENKYQYFHDAQCLVLPSRTENFGIVVVEALSQGTPVIASLGTPWHVLEETKAGFHIDNSPSSIAETIDNFIELDENEKIKMSEAAKKLADEYSVAHNMYRWEKYIY